MTAEEMKEVDAHLAEYKALREEMRLSIRRIDTWTGLYLAALFAIVAYLLRPCSAGVPDLETVTPWSCSGAIQNVAIYVNEFRKSPTASGYLLVLVVLNSVLLIRTANSISHILALASYIVCVLRPRLKVLLGAEALSWDAFTNLMPGPALMADPKTGWLRITAIGTVLEFGLAESISIFFLWIAIGVQNKPIWLTGLVVGAVALVAISMLCVVIVHLSGRTFPVGPPRVLGQATR